MTRLLVATLLASSALALPRSSPAQQEAPAEGSAEDLDTQAAKEHYRKGLEHFTAEQYPDAIKELKKAYLLKPLAPLLINIGQTYRKMGELDQALQYYRKYLAEAPAEDPKRAEIEGLVREMEQEHAAREAAEREALKAKQRAAAQQRADEEEAPRATRFRHQVIDEAPPGKPLDVRAEVPAGMKATINYRIAGAAEFVAVRMRKRFTEFVGRIPPDATQGKSLQYYIEVKNRAGDVVGSSGSAESPNIVVLRKGAPPQFYADLELGGAGEEEAPASARKPGDLRLWKWSAAGTAGAAFAAGLFFHLSAVRHAGFLEDEAQVVDGARPQFDADDADVDSAGRRFAKLATVSYAIGALAAGGAAYLFYLDRPTAGHERPRPERDAAAPGRLRAQAALLAGGAAVGAAVEF